MKTKKLNLNSKLNKKDILDLLNEARYFHNYLCQEDEAIKICDRILKHYPENRDALLIKAGSLSEIGKEKESFFLVNKIINKWPAHWEAYYLNGLLLFNTNEEMAMKNFIKSMNLKKTFDNCISAAQLTYFMQDESYKKYLEYAGKIDKLRLQNYMDKYWEWEIC